MKVFLVGLSQVPYSCRACDVRLDSFANLFVDCGAEVTVVNRYSSLGAFEDEHVSRQYEIKEIVPHHAPSRLDSLLFCWSIVKEFFFLLRYRQKSKQPVLLHVYSGHFLDMLFYRLISKLCGYKLVYQYVEYRSEEERGNIYHSINGALVDTKGGKYWDGAIVISHFLQQKALEVNPKLKYLVGPPICDFAQFDESTVAKSNVVLFCGSAGYYDIVELVVNSYLHSTISERYSLRLVLSGSNEQIEKVRALAPNATILTKLPYGELINEYKRAKILLIPLRDNVKDVSRFPNKVCEYAASKGVIVTTKFGEPSYFFENKKSAMISSDCSIEALSESLDWLGNNECQIPIIGERGYEVGVNSFNIKAYREKMSIFLSSLFDE